MEYKYVSLLWVAFALSSGSLLAQTTIAVQGSLKKTTDRTPVDFAEVLLRHPVDSSLVVGTVSNELGAFHLEATQGTFLLEVRALGYKPSHRMLTIPGMQVSSSDWATADYATEDGLNDLRCQATCTSCQLGAGCFAPDSRGRGH